MNMVAIIPARGGSKGVRKKNLRLLGGKPLIAHSIAAALSCRKVSRVVVSTDSRAIAAAAERSGAEVPFLRPAALARDDTPMLPVLIHAVRELERAGPPIDALLLLQPTSPFRGKSLVTEAVRRFEEERLDLLLALAPAECHPYWMKKVSNGLVEPFVAVPGEIPSRRQDLPPAYQISGTLYLWSRAALFRREGMAASGATQLPGERVGCVMVDERQAVDIDTEADLTRARFLIRKGARR